jgi:hypothetical protein
MSPDLKIADGQQLEVIFRLNTASTGMIWTGLFSLLILRQEVTKDLFNSDRATALEKIAALLGTLERL